MDTGTSTSDLAFEVSATILLCSINTGFLPNEKREKRQHTKPENPWRFIGMNYITTIITGLQEYSQALTKMAYTAGRQFNHNFLRKYAPEIKNICKG